MTPIRKVQAYDCTCSRCGHNWLARAIPARCAKCKRRTWNLKKGEKVQIGRPKHGRVLPHRTLVSILKALVFGGESDRQIRAKVLYKELMQWEKASR